MYLIGSELRDLLVELIAVAVVGGLFYVIERKGDMRRFNLQEPHTAYLIKHPWIHWIVTYSVFFLGWSLGNDLTEAAYSAGAAHSILYKYLAPLVFTAFLVLYQRGIWRAITKRQQRAA